MKSLIDYHPELCNEWNCYKNGELTEAISTSSRKKVWWKCENGHEWESIISSRTYLGAGCKECNRTFKKIDNTTCLLATHPELAKEWDYKKNGEYNPNNVSINTTKKKFAWICKNGHEFEAFNTHRKLGASCPHCEDGLYKTRINTEENSPKKPRETSKEITSETFNEGDETQNLQILEENELQIEENLSIIKTQTGQNVTNLVADTIYKEKYNIANVNNDNSNTEQTIKLEIQANEISFVTVNNTDNIEIQNKIENTPKSERKPLVLKAETITAEMKKRNIPKKPIQTNVIKVDESISDKTQEPTLVDKFINVVKKFIK